MQQSTSQSQSQSVPEWAFLRCWSYTVEASKSARTEAFLVKDTCRAELARSCIDSRVSFRFRKIISDATTDTLFALCRVWLWIFTRLPGACALTAPGAFPYVLKRLKLFFGAWLITRPARRPSGKPLSPSPFHAILYKRELA